MRTGKYHRRSYGDGDENGGCDGNESNSDERVMVMIARVVRMMGMRVMEVVRMRVMRVMMLSASRGRICMQYMCKYMPAGVGLYDDVGDDILSVSRERDKVCVQTLPSRDGVGRTGVHKFLPPRRGDPSSQQREVFSRHGLHTIRRFKRTFRHQGCPLSSIGGRCRIDDHLQFPIQLVEQEFFLVVEK